MQLCAGYDAVCEAAVHLMTKILNHKDIEALIFVDATNAFNQLNCQVTPSHVNKISYQGMSQCISRTPFKGVVVTLK